MSTDLKEKVPVDGRSNDVSLVQFFGGEDRGVCIQLTQESVAERPDAPMFECIQLTKHQAHCLSFLLDEWLEEEK